MPEKKIKQRMVPSSFDLSGTFTLLPLSRTEPWKSLSTHIRQARPYGVLGYCPAKLQLDARIYGIVSSFRIPYLSAATNNHALACELIRQMKIDFIVATQAEAIELEKILDKNHTSISSWHIILALDEEGAPLPAGSNVIAEVHSFPGMPYES